MAYTTIVTAFTNPDGSPYNGFLAVRVPQALTLANGDVLSAGQTIYPVAAGVAYSSTIPYALMRVPATTDALPAGVLIEFDLFPYQGAQPRQVGNVAVPESATPLTFAALLGGTSPYVPPSATGITTVLASYQMLTADYFCAVNPTSPATEVDLTLPNPADTTRPYTIKDTGGNAGVVPIKVIAPAGYLFEVPDPTWVSGNQFIFINNARQSITLRLVGNVWGSI